MTFHNVDFQFTSPTGKLIHVPSEKGRHVGRQVRELLGRYRWDPHFRHMGRGGHIAILHAHRESAWFCTADIESFFGSIRRNTVAAALRRAGVREHAHFAKWCTTRAPEGGYVLGYGLPASTHLATLVVQESPLGAFLRAAARAVQVEVYLDDVSLSGDDPDLLGRVYEGLLEAIAASGFSVSARKSSPPARRVRLFACDLEQGRTVVSEERRAAFYAVERSGWAADRFERYCRGVARGNMIRPTFEG